MVFLFKRFRKQKKDDEATPASAPADIVQEPAAPEPTDQLPEREPSPTTELSPVPEPSPSAPPPPLPTAPPPSAPVTPVASSAECFLCGTPLVDHHCPKCQMAWVE